MGRLDSHDVGSANQQRRGVSAVDYLHVPGPGVPGDHSGDEVVGTEVARQAPLDPADDIQEAVLTAGSPLPRLPASMVC
jgi:hypothetical protein